MIIIANDTNNYVNVDSLLCFKLIYFVKLIIILILEIKYNSKYSILQYFLIKNYYAFYLLGKFILFIIRISGC